MDEQKKLRVCGHCYEAIRSRGECREASIIYVDEEDETESTCDWCDEHGFDELYILN